MTHNTYPNNKSQGQNNRRHYKSHLNQQNVKRRLYLVLSKEQGLNENLSLLHYNKNFILPKHSIINKKYGHKSTILYFSR